jgi:ABC-2 type transport system ATP-binding protein
MEPVLNISNLRKEYEGFTLKDVSFRLPEGCIMGLIGPNGAGKTTIIKLVMNLVRRNAGDIRIFGKDNRVDEVAIKSRIGFVHDTPCFYGHLTLQQVKSIIAPFYRDWDDGVFLRLAREFDLPLSRRVRGLSRGMNMRFALSLALSHHADFLILDEPTSGLDPVFRRELLEILSELMEDEKTSVLFSTHITSDLERTADYVTLIDRGEILLSRPKDEIIDDWRIVKGPNELLDGDTCALFRGIRTGEFGFTALTSEVTQARRRFRDAAIFERPSLEDIMFFLTAGQRDA